MLSFATPEEARLKILSTIHLTRGGNNTRPSHRLLLRHINNALFGILPEETIIKMLYALPTVVDTGYTYCSSFHGQCSGGGWNGDGDGRRTTEVEVVVAVVKAMVVAALIVPKQMANQIPTMITIVSQWEERRNECHDGGGNNLNDDLW